MRYTANATHLTTSSNYYKQLIQQIQDRLVLQVFKETPLLYKRSSILRFGTFQRLRIISKSLFIGS